jgi:hypothetical protein
LHRKPSTFGAVPPAVPAARGYNVVRLYHDTRHRRGMMGPDDIELGENVTALAVPTRKPASCVLSIRVPVELIEPLERLAARDRSSLSALGKQALSEYITRRMTNLVPAGTPQTTNPAAAWVYPR